MRIANMRIFECVFTNKYKYENSLIPKKGDQHPFDVFSLSLSLRRGWFLPSRTVQTQPLSDHWQVLKDPSRMSIFQLSTAQHHFVAENVKKNNER